MMPTCPHCSMLIEWEYNDEIPEKNIYDSVLTGYCDCNQEEPSWIELDESECSVNMDSVYIAEGDTLRKALLVFKLQLKQREIKLLLKQLTEAKSPDENCCYGIDSKGYVCQFLAPHADSK